MDYFFSSPFMQELGWLIWKDTLNEFWLNNQIYATTPAPKKLGLQGKEESYDAFFSTENIPTE